MTYTDWQRRWAEGRIGFHQGRPHASLTHLIDALGARPQRVLVPLCGKAVDLVALAQAGHFVVGVEFVEQAAQAFFQEQGLPFERHSAPHPVYRSASIEIHVADIFELPAGALGHVDAIFDRAALVAVEPERRRAYATRMLTTLSGTGTMMLVTLDYYAELMQGPPHAVSPEEVHALYGTQTRISCVSSHAEADAPATLRDRGGSMTEQIWLCRREADLSPR